MADKKRKGFGNRLWLAAYDLLIFLFVGWVFLEFYSGEHPLGWQAQATQMAIGAVCLFGCRLAGGVYKQIWRYGGIQCYIRLLITDGVAFLLFFVLGRVVPKNLQIIMVRTLSISAMSLVLSMSMRMLYRYAYKCAGANNVTGRAMMRALKLHGVEPNSENDVVRVPAAIIGAGRVGVALAEELVSNPAARYLPRCFVDNNVEKVGRQIHGIPVFSDDDSVFTKLREYGIQELILAIPDADVEKKKAIFNRFRETGCKLKVYDYPTMRTADGKRHLRDFDIEELLFRKPIQVVNSRTVDYYKNKVVLITGGGGSIGSELCRQLAKMSPKQIIILDIYENGAYDVQQELRIQYKGQLNLCVEIASITNRAAMARVFETYHPQIVINAAAHKHVPLMEHNCIEAIENNVFGCKVVVDLCEEYGAERFMMVSTDKAVNPTNVMGATKRMCEMIVQSASTHGKVKYSCTRFGNVLGSAGSVIPLFRRQIAAGGPVTLTDRRIIRYFMTIPEASQLVLISGAMANNGELFVLDMGEPVKILDLAENMIRLSDVPNVEIVETGLRPGEKLYEELLVKTEELDKTDNDLIFIERDTPLDQHAIEQKLALLKETCAQDDDAAREALRAAVPTFKRPEEVNSKAANRQAV